MTQTRVRDTSGVVLTLLALAVVLAVVGVWRIVTPPPADDWPARVYRVCEQYAGLDLSGLAPLCVDAGYSERVYLQPTGAPAYWPPAIRTMQPEDLN